MSQPVVQLQMPLVCQSLKNEPELLLVMVSVLCACACACELCHNQKVSQCTVGATKTLYGRPEGIFCQVLHVSLCHPAVLLSVVCTYLFDLLCCNTVNHFAFEMLPS